jgi:predicted ATP-grasp superfamily ATP-dependent carboligase
VVRMDALITQGCNRISYSALRSLASLGLKVATADTGRIGMCQWSRFCSRSYLYTDPRESEEAYVDDIVRILKDSGAKFLLPGPHCTEILARNRDKLPPDVILPVESPEKIHRANDKAVMAAYAKEVKVNVPEVVQWTNWEELKKRLREIDGQVVVKLRKGYAAKWVYYPSTKEEAVDICRNLVERHSLGQGELPIVQQRVYGEGWGVACLYHEGKMLSLFTYRVLREKPVTGGTATMRVSMENKILADYAGRLLDSLSWHGIAMIDFIYDPGKQEAWFIEVNPRLWGSISHAVASGVDLVKLLYIASTQGPDEALKLVRPQREGVVGRWWFGDAMLSIAAAKNHKIINALRLLMPGGADDYDEFKSDDPGVSAGEIAYVMSHGFSSMWKRSA